MEILVTRLLSNRLYTEGTLTVNGLPFSHTLESSASMLPPGVYSVVLRSQSSGPRKIVIHTVPELVAERSRSIISGNVYSDAHPPGHIIIGDPLIPGCVVRSRAAYARLLERIEKCKTPITLTISNSNCKPNLPISHWL